MIHTTVCRPRSKQFAHVDSEKQEAQTRTLRDTLKTLNENSPKLRRVKELKGKRINPSEN